MAKAKVIHKIVDPQFLLERAQSAKVEAINKKCQAAILEGFTSMTTIASTGKKHTYSTDAHDQRNFSGKLTILNADPTITEVYWKTEDTQDFVLHTKDEFIAICIEATAHIETNIGQGVVLKKAVSIAGTVEEIELINWE
jgi:hypothetical protein